MARTDRKPTVAVLEKPRSRAGNGKASVSNGSQIADETRKEDILSATLKLAADEGFDKISIRKVAALAGVSPSLITYHYKTKTQLIAEAWWSLHTRESHQRDETIGRVSGIKRIEEGFRLRFQSTQEDVAPQLRVDFWSKTARTPALLNLYIKQENSLRDSHIAGLQAAVDDGDLDPDLVAELDLVEDLFAAMNLGILTWSSLHTKQKDRVRALQIMRLLISRLRPAT